MKGHFRKWGPGRGCLIVGQKRDIGQRLVAGGIALPGPAVLKKLWSCDFLLVCLCAQAYNSIVTKATDNTDRRKGKTMAAKAKTRKTTKRTTKKGREQSYRDLANMLLGAYLSPYLRQALAS